MRKIGLARGYFIFQYHKEVRDVRWFKNKQDSCSKKQKEAKSCRNLRASSTSWLFGGKEPMAIQSALFGRAHLGQHQPGHGQWPGLNTSLEQGISPCASLNTEAPRLAQWATNGYSQFHQSPSWGNPLCSIFRSTGQPAAEGWDWSHPMSTPLPTHPHPLTAGGSEEWQALFCTV